jgi:hypothetical protein
VKLCLRIEVEEIADGRVTVAVEVADGPVQIERQAYVLDTGDDLHMSVDLDHVPVRAAPAPACVACGQPATHYERAFSEDGSLRPFCDECPWWRHIPPRSDPP